MWEEPSGVRLRGESYKWTAARARERATAEEEPAKYRRWRLEISLAALAGTRQSQAASRGKHIASSACQFACNEPHESSVINCSGPKSTKEPSIGTTLASCSSHLKRASLGAKLRALKKVLFGLVALSLPRVLQRSRGKPSEQRGSALYRL